MPASTTEVSVCGINDSSFDEKVLKTFATATIEVKQAKKRPQAKIFLPMVCYSPFDLQRENHENLKLLHLMIQHL